MNSQSDDRILARRMLSGEEAAFDEFFDSHFPDLYRFALARVGQNADAAEEVVQAAIARAIRKLDTYRGEATLFSWLCTFCRHEIGAFYLRRRDYRQAPAGWRCRRGSRCSCGCTGEQCFGGGGTRGIQDDTARRPRGFP